MNLDCIRTPRARSFVLRDALVAVAWMVAFVPSPSRAASEPFAWPGWHTPPDQMRFIESRITGHDLEAWVDGFGPRPPLDPLDLARMNGATISSDPSAWEPVPPPARWAQSMIYDPLRDRMIVFGGQGYAGWSNEVWTLSLSGIPQWTLLATTGTPPTPRGFHSAVYDSVSDRMLIFGGTDGSEKHEVWQLSFPGLATWSKLTVAGTPPIARHWHSAVIDRARNRMVIYGGTQGSTALADAWALNLSGAPAWTPIAAQGPAPARQAHAAVYDAIGDRMLVLCGLDSQPKNDVWQLSFAGTPTWSALAATGTPPSARFGASALYDQLRRQVVLFAGGTGAPNSSETWLLSLSGTVAWSALTPTSTPQGRQFHSVAYDPIGDRMLAFGGSSGPILSDAWALSLTPNQTWRPLSGTRRKGHSAVLDGERNRMLVFGGENATQLNDVWELALESTPRWTRLNPDGTPPPPRALHGALYDAKRDRMIVFGGRGAAPMNDIWELSFSGELAWRQVTAVGTPPAPRLDPCVVFDTTRRRMLVFGGADASGVFNDVWALSLSGTPTWTQLGTSGGPPAARGGAQAIYDRRRDRLVIYGGYNRNFLALGDVWALSLAGTPTWTALAPTGTAPAPRFAAATAYDSARDRMVISSGTDFTTFFAETWSLDFASGVPAWIPIALPGAVPSARSDHKAVYDEARDRFVFFGGINPLGILHDAWALDFTAVVAVPQSDPASQRLLTLAPVTPNPAAGPATIAFTLPERREARVRVYDARGRSVRMLSSGELSGGPHTLVWDGRDERGARAPAGLYFVSVESGPEHVSGKMVIVR